VALACLDMAGTTVTDGGIVERAFLAALAAVGIAEDDPGNPERLAFVQRTMGQSKIEVFRGLLDHEEQAQRALVAFEGAIAEQVGAGAVTPVPGAVEAFAAFRARGVQVCLTTGFTAETQHLILDHLGWHRSVDLALAPSEAVRGRPYPDLVLSAVLRLRIDDVAQVLVAGDTASDLLAGSRAGARIVAGVRTGAHTDADFATVPHTHVVDSVADLPGLVGA
jgi:phosphoglycolate phosphatase